MPSGKQMLAIKLGLWLGLIPHFVMVIREKKMQAGAKVSPFVAALVAIGFYRVLVTSCGSGNHLEWQAPIAAAGGTAALTAAMWLTDRFRNRKRRPMPGRR